MARHPDLEPAFSMWTLRLGSLLRQIRLDRGWTQAEAAERCGIDYKQFQGIEYGRARLTLLTLYRVARGYRLEPRDLLPTLDGPVPEVLPPRTRPKPVWQRLVDAGWRVRSGQAKLRGQTLPIYDLSAAAGPAECDTRLPRVAAWARPPAEVPLAGGDFLVQALGDSMEPLIGDGDWCLFRRPVDAPLVGRIVLLGYASGGDQAEHAWQIKRIGGLALSEDEDGLDVRLDSVNPVHPVRVTRVRTEGELEILGQFVRVVTRATAKTPRG